MHALNQLRGEQNECKLSGNLCYLEHLHIRLILIATYIYIYIILQQPDAKATNECQDDSSKRSLVWFMNWIRKDFGDEKADKLWKRIGT